MVRKRRLDELNRLSPDAFRHAPRCPIVLVLDNIRSGLNVGSIFRTADAFAAESVYLCGITPIPPHREILKTAIGATTTMAWVHHSTIAACLSSIREKGFEIIGIEQTTTAQPLPSLEIQTDRKYALVFGNEVSGLSEQALPLIDRFLEIPQFGTKHSLNVSVCAGIAMWEFWKALGLLPREMKSGRNEKDRP